MKEEIKVTYSIKGVMELREWGMWIDGELLTDILKSALPNEIEKRPCNIWVSIQLPEQGVDVR